MSLISKRLLKLALYSLAFVPISPAAVVAQTFPAFPAPSVSTPVSLDTGVSSAQVPNGYYNTVLMSVWSTNNDLSYSISADGLTSVYTDKLVNLAGGYYIDCNANVHTCSASIAMYNNRIYIAFADSASQGLDVFEASPVPGNVGYTFQLVYQDRTSPMSTSPAMAVFNNQLVIIYGVNTPSLTNAFFEVTLNNVNWNPATEQNLGAKYPIYVASGARPGLAAFQGKLWMCSQQNNSYHNLYVYSSIDGTTWVQAAYVPAYQLGGGASMVVFNNNLVLATQQNNSNSELFIFSSPNGTSWTVQGYPNFILGSYPALALFNGNISLQYPAKTSTRYLQSTLASH